LEEVSAAKRALEEQLLNERQGRSSALTVAGRAKQETAALKRVLDAMGCKIRISKSKSTTYAEGEVRYDENFDDSDDSDSAPEGEGKQITEEEGNQLAVSVSMEGDSAAYHLRRACAAEGALMCSPEDLEHPCTWPQGRCARLGSAFVGLKADFSALEQLSVLDCYFDPEKNETGPSNVHSNLPGIT
jgi:myotubularin-related protein 1/2